MDSFLSRRMVYIFYFYTIYYVIQFISKRCSLFHRLSKILVLDHMTLFICFFKFISQSSLSRLMTGRQLSINGSDGLIIFGCALPSGGLFFFFGVLINTNLYVFLFIFVLRINVQNLTWMAIRLDSPIVEDTQIVCYYSI